MPAHLFLSYSSVDGKDFSLKLADELASGPPPFPVWLDKRELRPSEQWDDQIVEAIKDCKGLIFIMTPDSVQSNSVCKNEWVRALRYKKPVIPLLLNSDAELPFSLGSREYVDFTGAFDAALARLRKYLVWADSPEGQLKALEYRVADAKRELSRAQPEQEARIREDIAELERQVAQQKAVIANPRAAEERVAESIKRGLELVREPSKPLVVVAQTKFINPPPLIAPTWFQDRHVETKLVGDFLKDDALRQMTIVGRGGVGKSAMVCRLLRSLEGGQLPDDGGPLSVDGIVYLSDARSFHRVTVPDLYAGLTKLLPDDAVRQLDAVYKNPKATTQETMRALTEAFPSGRTVVLLDNFEDEVDVESGRIKNAELNEGLRALLELPPHGLKVIVTTRVLPRELALVEPGRQRRRDLDEGLEHPYAENILRAMDSDGKIGLKDAPDALLAQARDRTRGYPRALEHLFGILSADRDTSLQNILDDTKQLLPEQVVAVLVGEAFSRLDLTAQRVVQALAIYRYPVPGAAVDYLLQPYVPGIDSAPVLSRLVNMQFVRRDAGRYYLHQVDRDYAVGRIPEGQKADRGATPPPFTRYALQHRAAEWFAQSRKPREAWKTLDDLAAQFSEFELRMAGEDYDTAAALLLTIDFEYLFLWGHYRLMTQLHERLQGKINDPILEQNSVGNLGSGYIRMGFDQKSVACYERALALARQIPDRSGEGTWLGNLGTCFAEMGQTQKAIDYYKQGLAIHQEVGNRQGESLDLSGLGWQYGFLGQSAVAIDYYEQALAIDREQKDRPNQALDLCNLGERYACVGQTEKALRYLNGSLAIVHDIGYRLVEAAIDIMLGHIQIDRDDLETAAKLFKEAADIADEIGNTQTQQGARMGIALTGLLRDELVTARAMAEEARKYDLPLYNHSASALLGAIVLRQGDRAAARETLALALDQANEVLARSPQFFEALDSKGLILAGLALCEGSQHLADAEAAYTASRALNRDPVAVGRVLRLLDALRQADGKGILDGVRSAAAGESK